MLEKLAREAGIHPEPRPPIAYSLGDYLPPDKLEAFARAIAERCAEICQVTTEYGDSTGETEAWNSAKAIRADFGLTE